ncbi:MAG: arylsulfatase [Bacteroidota bacterium]
MRATTLASLSICFCLMMGLLACSAPPPADSDPLPNVLLILTDDQGYGDIGTHGNDSIRTPEMDRMAQEGIRLDNFFVSPVCAPTRASLLTGRYHFRTGTNWVTRNAEAMRGEETTLAELFQANGYATGAFGKWHNGAHGPNHPLGQGFAEFVGFCAGHWSNYFNPPLEANHQPIQPEGYINDILTDSALSFMQRSGDQPFFCYIPFNTPHTPFIAPQELYEQYLGEGRSKAIASTYGMVENIDQNLIRLRKYLEASGQRENTLVIFMTDNGPNFDRFNGGMKGRKGHVNDGGVRVPCLVEWPGQLTGGTIISEMTAHIDWLPTFVDLLNLTPVKTLPLDGTSISSLLTGEAEQLPDRTFYTFAPSIERYRASVRTRQHRLVITGENEYELTDFQTDRAEANPLTDSLSEVAQSLYEGYLAAFEDVTQGIELFPPLPLAHPTEPTVILHAHEGFPTGKAHYKASQWGWANDWFVDWSTPTDSLYWNVDVAEESEWEVLLRYSAKPENLGAMLHLTGGEPSIQAELTEPFEPELIPSRAQLPRKVEALEVTWAEMPLGSMRLPAGRHRLVLQASNIQAGEVAWVRALILKRK